MDKAAYLLISELRDLLVARAGGKAADETPYPADSIRADAETYAEAYVRLRAAALELNQAKGALPLFVQQYRTLDSFWLFIQPKFAHYKERRSYLHEQFEPLLTRLEAAGAAVTDSAMKGALETRVDWDYVEGTWQKALDRRAADPEAALTSARTLLETVCKHVLDEAKVAYSSDGKIEPLVRAASQEISSKLSPDVKPAFEKAIPASVDIVVALGTLRNKAGDSHGRGKGGGAIEPWQSELAVNLAGAVSAFLIQGWSATQAKGRGAADVNGGKT